MNGSRILHHDNTQAHNALSVKTILVKHKIPVLEHLPYSSDLVSCDLFSFPKIKSTLTGIRFKSTDAVRAKVTRKGPAAFLPTAENSHGAV
jgi:exosome complex RNA-binding protein Csl4